MSIVDSSIPIRGSSSLREALRLELERWQLERGRSRLLQRDASLWTADGESDLLGWLDLPARGPDLCETIAGQLRSWRLDRPSDVVLLGMGGSSLGARALAELARRDSNAPPLLVLDSTDPDTVTTVARQVDPEQVVFFVASKSGGTLETRTLADYLSVAVSARRMVAITDPGSGLEREAPELGYAGVVAGAPDVGGRFSVLSAFGLAPAWTAGVDVVQVCRSAATARAELLAADRIPSAPEVIGCTLGVAAKAGGVQIEIAVPPRWTALADWLEQLLAESLGKDGTGLLPVIESCPSSDPEALRVRLPAPAGGLKDDGGAATLAFEQSLDAATLGAALFSWEVATAVAGWSLGVNPFDQPDVESAKVETRRLVSELEAGVTLDGTAAGRFESFSLSAPGSGDPLAVARAWGAPASTSAAADSARGEYLALLAFLPEREEVVERLERLRRRAAERAGIAATLGFGPRYLHSTGQLHKGGPPNGRFLILTAEREDRVLLPGRPYGFADIQRAQAMGDAEALAERGRLVLLAHLRRVDRGLDELERLLLDPDLLA